MLMFYLDACRAGVRLDESHSHWTQSVHLTNGASFGGNKVGDSSRTDHKGARELPRAFEHRHVLSPLVRMRAEPKAIRKANAIDDQAGRVGMTLEYRSLIREDIREPFATSGLPVPAAAGARLVLGCACVSG